MSTATLKPRTMFEKVWDQHVVVEPQGEPTILYIDLQLVHEVTSPQAFDGLRLAGRQVHRPDRHIATVDHNVPTTSAADRLVIADQISAAQVNALRKNCKEFGIEFYDVQDNVLSPKPKSSPRPTLYAGGESETAKNLIASKCDSYLMHGDPPEIVGEKIKDMRRRREAMGLGPMTYGIAGYAIVRDSEAEALKEVDRITDVQQSAQGYKNYQQWITGSNLEQKISLKDYSVSNRGLRSGFVGTPEQVSERMEEFTAVGVDLVLLQSSPQAQEVERFAVQVIKR